MYPNQPFFVPENGHVVYSHCQQDLCAPCREPGLAHMQQCTSVFSRASRRCIPHVAVPAMLRQISPVAPPPVVQPCATIRSLHAWIAGNTTSRKQSHIMTISKHPSYPCSRSRRASPSESALPSAMHRPPNGGPALAAEAPATQALASAQRGPHASCLADVHAARPYAAGRS